MSQNLKHNLKHKILTQEETPTYSFRKYSFGLASALIGLTAFSGGLKGTIAKADTVSNSAVADQKDIDAKQNNKQATLDISYSDDQKQAANVQAKNTSKLLHNKLTAIPLKKSRKVSKLLLNHKTATTLLLLQNKLKTMKHQPPLPTLW